MDVDEAHAALALRTFGDAADYYDRRNPRLDSEGNVQLSPEDGEILLKVPARSVIQYVTTLESSDDIGTMMRQMSKRETRFRLFSFTVMVTRARVIWTQDATETPGKRLVGHLRYPWIRTISYRPKQSFLNDSMLNLEFMENFPIAVQGSWFSDVQLGFKKEFDPREMAQLIARLAAAHNLQYRCPEAVRADVERMTTVGLLDPPNKNETSSYFMPVHAEFPSCVDYIADGTAPGTWSYAGRDDDQ